VRAVNGGDDVMIVLAYFDPGAGSLLMQALVGGAAGLLVFGRYVWQTCIRHPASRRRQNARA
jgi:hypothetical protein